MRKAKGFKKIFVSLGVFFFVFSPIRFDTTAIHLLSAELLAGTSDDYGIVGDATLIEQDTTWAKTDTLTFNQQVIIVNGATLTIEPGAQIYLGGSDPNSADGYLAVNDGAIKALGTQAEPIVFSGSAGFRLEFFNENPDNEASIFSYTTFTGGGWKADDGGGSVGQRSPSLFQTAFAGESGYGALFYYSGKVRIEDSLFSENYYADIEIDNSFRSRGISYDHLTVVNSRFGGNRDGTAVSVNDAFCHEAPCENRIFLENNWWGDVSGPAHVTNLSGMGNAIAEVAGHVDFTPWLTSDPSLIFDLCVENCYSNILFLPGLEASRLYIQDGSDENQLWEPNREADAEKLFLDENGKSIRDDVVTRDVIDNAYFPIKGNIYKSFLDDLDQWKNTDGLIFDYAVTPYDWRLTIDEIIQGGKKTGDHISYTDPTNSPYIIETLRRLASTSKSGKVTVIAHSNGGLVAKALISKLGAEAAELIDTIVFVAVPQSGTPQAIGAILHGYDQGLPVNWFPFTLAPKTARALANNMPSAYNLLPSDAYFSGEGSGVTTPVVTFAEGVLTDSFISKYGKKVDTSTELRDFLSDNDGKVAPNSNNIASPSIVNSALLSDSENVQKTLDAVTIPVSIAVYQIAGFGEETLGTIKYWTGKTCVNSLGHICLAYGPKLEYTPELVADGDGTVVASSALALSTVLPNVSRWWVDLNKYNNELPESLARFDGEHANIFEVSGLRDFIKENILTGTTTALPALVSNDEPPTSSEKRLRYFLHSPLALSAHNSAGQIISASVDTYPGATYRRFGEVQYISLPADSAPTLELDGLNDGFFTLEVQEAEGDVVIATTTFAAIPTSADTVVTMDFTDGTIENALPLLVNYDGEGSAEFSLQPQLGETVIPDSIPPVTEVSLAGISGTNDRYTSDVTLTLSATDDTEGSGVEKTEYSLNNGTTWNTYTDPLTLSQEGTTTIQYFSTDKQGNKEEAKTLTVKIDKTAPEAQFVFNPTTQKLDIIGTDNLDQAVVVSMAESVIPDTRSIISWLRERFRTEKERKASVMAILTDQAGHTTEIVFEKKKDKEHRIDLSLQSISYDGEITLLSQTRLQYKWQLDRKKKYRLFASQLRTDSAAIESHYILKKNETWIMERPWELADDDNDDDSEHRPIRTKLSGMVIPSTMTEKGKVIIKY